MGSAPLRLAGRRTRGRQLSIGGRGTDCLRRAFCFRVGGGPAPHEPRRNAKARASPSKQPDFAIEVQLKFRNFTGRRRSRAQTRARLALAWAINALALWVANRLFTGVLIHGWTAYLVGAAVLGIANAVVKPVLAILTLPLILVTLGFFLLLINVAMVALAAWITPNFSIHGFWTYVGVVIVLWVVNWAGNSFIDRAVQTARR
jgi:putative membrane protein